MIIYKKPFLDNTNAKNSVPCVFVDEAECVKKLVYWFQQSLFAETLIVHEEDLPASLHPYFTGTFGT